MRPTLGLVLCFIPVALATGCGEDSPAEAPATPDAYLSSLPSWSEFSPPLADADVAGSPSAPVIHTAGDGSRYGCFNRPCSITRTPGEITVFGVAPPELYVGALLQGNGHVGGIGALQELAIPERSPLTILIDLPAPDNTRTVSFPDRYSVNQAVNELVASASQTNTTAGSIDFRQDLAHSARQGILALELSPRYVSDVALDQLQTSHEPGTTTLQAYFVQRIFKISMTRPQRPADVFDEDFTLQALDEYIRSGRIGADNVPAYVSDITFGRILLLTMTSTFPENRMRSALTESRYAAQDGTPLSGEALAVLQDSDTQIEVVAIGDSNEAVKQMVVAGTLDQFFSQGAPLTSTRPISYTVRGLTDNAIAYVSETVSYDLPLCVGATYYEDESEWEAALQRIGATIYRLDTTDENVALCDEVEDPPTGQFGVGRTMTFARGSTGVPIEFQLNAPNWTDESEFSTLWSGLVCHDQELPGERAVSIGDVDDYENDDFEVRVEAQIPVAADVFGLAITAVHNAVEAGEAISLYDRDDVLIESFTPLGPDNVPAFIGVVSGVPLSRLFFDEHPGGDDIGVRDFRIGLVQR